MGALNKLEMKTIGDSIPGYVASVNGSYTSNTAGTIFDASSTQRLRIKGWDLTVFVAVTLAGSEAAGDYVIMYDSVVTAPIAVLGIIPIVGLKVGSILGTTSIGSTTFTTAATVFNTGMRLDHIQSKKLALGYTTTAAGNDIKFGVVVGSSGALVTVSTGVVRAVGTLNYDLV